MGPRDVMKIAVIIPAYNEEPTIGEVIEGCLALRDQLDMMIVVVDDGCTDRTPEIAREKGAQVVSHSENMGVGQTFQTGLAAALQSGADVIVNIDADGQFDPATIPVLIEPIVGDRADFATASRFKDPALVPQMPGIKLWGNRMMSRIISGIAGRRFHDVSCGFRAYTRDAALQLNLWGSFTYTQESILDLAIKGVRIEEVPLRIEGVRKHGESKVAPNVWNYGWRAMKIILHTYRDYWPLYFFGWLSLPFMGLGGVLMILFFLHRLIAGAFSPHIWMGFTAAALIGMGILILVTGIVGEMLKRIRLNQERMMVYHKKAEYPKK
jgi:glycosyltransferase involved in cell wall biosynthesis